MTDATRPLADRLGAENLRLLENIGVRLTVEVGRTEMTIRDLLRLSEGSVVGSTGWRATRSTCW